MSNLKELVKKHFNLIDAPSTDSVIESIFGEIKTADGELTLSYEGEELAVGLAIFIVTPDGNIPAPDGEHLLEGGVAIKTEGGMITDIMAEEVEVEVEVEAESTEEKMEEVVVDVAEPIAPAIEDIIEAVAEIISPMIEEMKKEIEEMKSQFTTTKEKVETFAAAPSAEKTIPTAKSNKVDMDYKPLNETKQKQFDRLLKIRNKN